MQIFARVFLLIAMAVVAGCASSSATKVPASAVNESAHDDHIDGFFVVPELDLRRYKKMVVSDLQLDNIQVRRPASMPSSNSWALSASQERIFREQYIGAVVTHMIADGTYRTSIDSGEDVLLLRASIVQIEPLTSSDNRTSSRISMQPEAMVTIAIEVYDSQSNQLLATLTDSYNFGPIWEEGKQPTHNLSGNNAFDFWLGYLRHEMDVLSAR